MNDRELMAAAMHALRSCYGANDLDESERLATIAALRQRLEQPEQEPIAWGWLHKDGTIYDCISPGEHDREPGRYTTPLYTRHQPAAQLARLTDEEIVVINDQHYNIAFRDFDADVAIARAIEAKLREKSGGAA